MSNIIKVTLAFLFFVCLLHMPYGYYRLVRFLATAGFIILAYESTTAGDKNQTIVYVVLACLFQPFFKLALGREVWNGVDVVIAIGLLISLFKKSK